MSYAMSRLDSVRMQKVCGLWLAIFCAATYLSVCAM